MRLCRTQKELIDYRSRTGPFRPDLAGEIERDFGISACCAVYGTNRFEYNSIFTRVPKEDAAGWIVQECPRFICTATREIDGEVVDLKGDLVVDRSSLDKWSSRNLNYFDRNPDTKAFYVDDPSVLDDSKVYIGKPFGTFSIRGILVYKNLLGVVVSVSRGEVIVEGTGLPSTEIQSIRVSVPHDLRPAALLGRVIEFNPEGKIEMVKVI